MTRKKFSWEELHKMRAEFMKDPEFRKDLKEFIRLTSQ